MPIFCSKLSSLSPTVTSSVDERIELVSRANTLVDNKKETTPNNKQTMQKLFEEVDNLEPVIFGNKDLNIEKNSKSTIIIAFILLASLIFNIMNFIQILNK